MILSNVNIGTGPSAGDGDPLRTAFNTINTNFTHIQNNVNSLTNSVSSVAGRTGNVTLTTQDIIGINNYATTSYVTSITGGNAVANITALESNVALIQADINTLYGNAGVQSSTLATLTSNAATQADALATLTANAAAQSGDLATLLANAAVQAGDIATMLANAGSQHEAISSLQANVSTLFANAGAQAGSITDLQSNAAIQAGLIAGLQANVNTYSDSNVASYLASYSGNVSVANIIFDDLSVQTTAYTGTQWRSNLNSNVRVKPSWLSYVPGGKNQEGTQYGFDSSGMFFTSNADDDFAYPIQTSLQFHEEDVLEVVATIYFGATGDDHGLSIFSADTRPIWKSGVDTSRIAFQYSAGIPVLYGQTTANTSPGSPVLSVGNYYTVKFRYDPGNTVVVETFSGNTATGTPIDSRSIGEVLPAGDYKVGFDADNDAVGVKSYWTNLIVRTLTNTVVNDLEVQGQVTGNLIPSANVVYSLGNVTHQWKDLYVSSNTIYIGGDELTISSGNLTINGNVIPSFDQVQSVVNEVTFDQDLNTTDNVNFSNLALNGGQLTVATDIDFSLNLNDSSFGPANMTVDTQGYMTVSGGVTTKFYGLENPSDLYIGSLGWNSNRVDVAGIYGFNITTGIEGTGGVWQFNDDGTNTFPGGLLFDVFGQIYNTTGTMVVGSSNYDVQILANVDSGYPQTWTFGVDGNLTVPNNSYIVSSANVYVDADGYIWNFRSDINALSTQNGSFNSGTTYLSDGILSSATGNALTVESGDDLYMSAEANVLIQTDASGSFPTWTFATNGSLTFPDSTAQTTAWTGAVTAIANGTSNVKIAASGGNIDFNVNGSRYGTITTTGGVALGYHQLPVSGSSSVIAIGTDSGLTGQGDYAIALGRTAGWANQGRYTVAIGFDAGKTAQVDNSIAIGRGAGSSAQSGNAVAIGTYTGQYTQGENAVAVGRLAGNNSQGGSAVAVGSSAGADTQGINAVALGGGAGFEAQGASATALGAGAGSYNQSTFAVAVGAGAAYSGQGTGAIAIGTDSAPVNQGQYSIAIGALVSTNAIQPNNSIIIDATASELAATGAGLFVAPVRQDDSNIANVIYYNTSTKEITYGPAASGGSYGNTEVNAYLQELSSITFTASPAIISGLQTITTTTANVTANITVGGNVSVGGVLKIDEGVHEAFQAKADATGVVEHDCSQGHIFYHTSPDANWTANFANLSLDSGYATTVSLIIAQGGTGFYPNVVQIGGASQTINWQGNTTPTPSTNRTDVATFSIINNSSTYTVLGQLTGF